MPSPYRVADYIADFIAGLGVEHVFLLPGGGAMHLNDAVGKHERLEVVACHHEQAAAIAAEAYCRINENLGVAMVTTGPGATNAVTAVAGAWIESVPLLVVSGQVKRADLLRGAPLRQRGVQEVDIVSVVTPITKYAVTIERPEDIRRELERAAFLARDGRAGPVWVDVPLDVQGAPIDPARLEGWQPDPAPAATLDPALLEQVRRLLEGAERPLILAGHGVRLSGAAKAFRNLVEALGVPVVTTWNAMDLLPHEHPLYVGRPGVVALRAPNFAVQNADLLIAIGCRLDNIITAYAPRDFARAARKVVVDVDTHEIDKLDMPIEVAISSDAGDFIAALGESLGDARFRRSQWLERCADWKARYGVNDGKPFPVEGPISHFQFADALSDAVPADTLVSTGSSGLAVEVFYTVFRNRPGQRVFLTSGLGAMGYGLPAAIGACFANGRKPMVAVESDGSLQLNLQELATLRGFDLPICLVVMNNGGYASIRNTQRNYFEGRYVGTGPEAGLWMPDLEELARAYHLPFKRIRHIAELAPGLAEAMAQPRPMIVEVMLQKDEALSPKVAAVPQADGSMTSMPLEDMSPLLPLEQLQAEMLVPLSPVSLAVRR
ncbi:thiamine pyrophosphate-binding protein [Metapseudomonas furukawaii]|uniref:Acetolactate synthase large subunit n=1 Tax=Metapseudomonas furukawaii TaxID=1149133 RepID=A0AAD1FGZ5_METFU|nr:thiamine pyrophosphate-binding protein [Pseudomonas furukawaii]ELS29433.1 Acetolactate synthase large subunit [Pseudomonas furukawaii]BAU75717.1 acetolactate synthase large subunit [Pseudomonas furukawaii]